MKKGSVSVLPSAEAPISSKGYRFPPRIISYAVWLYYRFPLHLRMVEEMLAYTLPLRFGNYVCVTRTIATIFIALLEPAAGGLRHGRCGSSVNVLTRISPCQQSYLSTMSRITCGYSIGLLTSVRPC
ncbi:hypothetical protein B0G75_14322 [Paraburkholderia sp. BL18I3N2]|nr:hypothetical protein B0G75_14322 [Paraburkholderia sp. BL18I3N2]PRX92668.1 hypothetical protein B0G73_13495 [Paraburkholderia sp. BL25I1N1]